MLKINAQIVGLTELSTQLRHVPRLVDKHTRRRMSMFGRKVIGGIRRDTSVFHGGGGALKSSLWTKRDKGSQPVQQMGWAVPYGEVLEFGPKFARSWKIKPKGFRSDISLGRSGGRQALKMLRFEWNGKICYAKEVTHNWDKSQLRPHFKPVMELYEPIIQRSLGLVVKQVVEGRLG